MDSKDPTGQPGLPPRDAPALDSIEARRQEAAAILADALLEDFLRQRRAQRTQGAKEAASV